MSPGKTLGRELPQPCAVLTHPAGAAGYFDFVLFNPSRIS